MRRWTRTVLAYCDTPCKLLVFAGVWYSPMFLAASRCAEVASVGITLNWHLMCQLALVEMLKPVSAAFK